MSVLYISYNGLLEPLGQSQVFQYLLRLSKTYRILLITYEKKKDWDDQSYRQSVANRVREAGIRWIPLRYHKRPKVFSTFYDLILGLAVCFYVCFRYRIQIVHARAYVPAVFGLLFQKLFRVKFIFDMRSFWPDDLLEAGILKEASIVYKTAKWFERQFLINADVVIALTHKAVDVMKGYSFLQGKKVHFEIIPTCTNLDLFHPALSSQRQGASVEKKSFTLGYVGNAGLLYLFDEALAFFKILVRRDPEARFLIINRDDHAHIFECLQRQRVNGKNFEVKSVEHRCVPFEIAQMDAGVFFYTQTNSHASRAPTKLGEFLACGVPCVSNADVGDVAQIIQGEGVGVIIHDFTRPSLEKAIKELIELVRNPDVGRRCVAAAQKYFSLEDGIRTYSRIYHDLMQRER